MLAATEPTRQELDTNWTPPSAEVKKRTQVRRVTRLLTVPLTDDDREELLIARAETERELRLRASDLREKKKRLDAHIRQLRERTYGELSREVQKLSMEARIHGEELDRGSRRLPVLVEERKEGGMLKSFRVDTGEWVRDVALPLSRF